MTEFEKYEMYERCIPTYLKHDIEEYLKNKDRRMRFNNSKDPIYYVFDCIENRPIKTLAKEFVKDTIKDTMSGVMKFVSLMKN